MKSNCSRLKTAGIGNRANPRKSEPGFVVAKFAFVSCGECVDCTTVIMPNALVENARQNFMDYVKKVGPDTPVSDIRIPEIPRFERGVVELADIINVARTGDVAEIAIHTYSIKHRIDVAQCEEQDMKADLVAMLRSNISIQIKWIMSLYDQD